jgi:uncharacterized protein (DUF433 family)
MSEQRQYNVTEAHITQTPGVCGGKPCIAGRRIRVQDVYIWHEMLGMDTNEIASQYNLTPSQVYAALTYAFDNLEQIKADIQESDRVADEFKQKHPDKLKKLPGE